MKTSNLFWGVLLIGLALLLVLNPLGFFQEFNIFKGILALIFGIWFFQSIFRIDFPGVLFAAAFIAIIFAQDLGLTAITPWPVLGGAALGSIGLKLMFPNARIRKHLEPKGRKEIEIINFEDDDGFSASTAYGACVKYLHSQNLSKGTVSGVCGGVKIFFDNAKLAEDGATLYFDLSFSGAELYIPKDWKVINNLYTSFSGVDEKNKVEELSEKSNKVLTLDGNLSFSGVTIIYI